AAEARRWYVAHANVERTPSLASAAGDLAGGVCFGRVGCVVARRDPDSRLEAELCGRLEREREEGTDLPPHEFCDESVCIGRAGDQEQRRSERRPPESHGAGVSGG